MSRNLEDVYQCDLTDLSLPLNYILKDSYSDYKETIYDPLIPVYSTCTQVIRSSSDEPFHTSGVYIIGLVNDIAPEGAICYYALTNGGLASLMNWITGLDQDNDISNWAMLQFGDIMGAIVDCFWLPISHGDVPGLGSQTVRLGRWNAPLTAKLLNTVTCAHKVSSIDLSDIIPTDFRKSNGFCNCSLFIPYYGNVNIPVSKIAAGLQLDIRIDCATGEVLTIVYTAGSGHSEAIATLS